MFVATAPRWNERIPTTPTSNMPISNLPRTSRSLLLAFLSASWLVTVPPAKAQSSRPASAAQADNFVHPPGPETSPLGHLGNFVKRGNGPVPMILIPGAAFDRTVWDTFMKRNADRYTMYAVTQAGYGGTPPPPMPEKVDDFEGMEWTRGFCRSLLDLITREKLDRPVLVAHHFMADGYALRLALDDADLVRGVVVVAGRGSVQIPAMPRKPGALVQLADAPRRAAQRRPRPTSRRCIAP